MNDPEYPFAGPRPDWNVLPPEQVRQYPLEWYRERDLDAVLAAAEAAAALVEART